jgi:hypothetical protein
VTPTSWLDDAPLEQRAAEPDVQPQAQPPRLAFQASRVNVVDPPSVRQEATGEAGLPVCAQAQHPPTWKTSYMSGRERSRQRSRSLGHTGTGGKAQGTVETYAKLEPYISTRRLMSLEKMQMLSLIIVPDIVDPLTTTIVNECLRNNERESAEGFPVFGAPGSFFPAGSWCYNALLATPQSSQVAWLIGTHKKLSDLGVKTVMGVSITALEAQAGSNADTSSRPTLLWHIGKRKRHDVECVQH